MSKKRECPCGGADYRACCRPFHEGAEPPDPGAMVRSRFSAFALGDGEYLWRTLDPKHELRARPKDDVVRELSRAKAKYKYMRVTIHEVDGHRALFTARVFERGRDRSFMELSSFTHAGGWRYLDGLTLPANALDAPTIAGFEAKMAAK